MSDDMDWLSELVPGGEDEAAGEAVPEAAEPFAVTASGESSGLLDDLRTEMVAAEAEPATAAERSRPRRSLGGLLPWQLFFLSVLLFLDIGIIGLLFLVMSGRIVIPF